MRFRGLNTADGTGFIAAEQRVEARVRGENILGDGQAFRAVRHAVLEGDDLNVRRIFRDGIFKTGLALHGGDAARNGRDDGDLAAARKNLRHALRGHHAPLVIVRGNEV